MSKARTLTRIKTRSESNRVVPRKAGSRRYVRAMSPTVVRGDRVGAKSENVRGRYSEPDLRDLLTDREAMARASGRRSKLTARVASLRKTRK